jgi:hypothetical protein
MKSGIILCLTLVLSSGLSGCARVNRHSGDFYGVAQTGTFRSSAGDEEVGLLFSVHRTGNIEVTGHDSKHLPLTNITAILITRRARLFPAENVPVDQELRVRGTLDTTPVKSKTRNSYIRQIGTSPTAFQPVIRVKKVYPQYELPAS